jgi:hypothetical protein
MHPRPSLKWLRNTPLVVLPALTLGATWALDRLQATVPLHRVACYVALSNDIALLFDPRARDAGASGSECGDLRD